MPRRNAETSGEVHRQQIIETMGRYVAEHGMRHTPERLFVLDAVLETSGRFTVDDIAARMSGSSNAVSRGTVANTLKLLVELGVVFKVGLHKRAVVYQTAPKSRRKNSRARLPIGIVMQCMQCGSTREVRDREATAALASRRYNSFFPVSGLVTIYGLCEKCSAHQNN